MSQSSNHLRLVSWTWQWVHFTQMASTVTRSHSNRAALGCVEREIHIMDVQPTNLQQLCDAIVSIWTKISEECFQHLVESMPRRIKAVLKTKVGPTRYQQGVPNKVASECVYIYIYIYIYICIYIYIKDQLMAFTALRETGQPLLNLLNVIYVIYVTYLCYLCYLRIWLLNMIFN